MVSWSAKSADGDPRRPERLAAAARLAHFRANRHVELRVFSAGATCAVLDRFLCDDTHEVPVPLLANRLAHGAATGTSKLDRRRAQEFELRDAFHLTRTGRPGRLPTMVADVDRELKNLPPQLRRREWIGWVEAISFASAFPVGREDLARVVGQGVSVEMLIGDIQIELAGGFYASVPVADRWNIRTGTQFADAIRAASDLGVPPLDFTGKRIGAFCANVPHQLIDRAGERDIFGKGISRDSLVRLRDRGLIASGPRGNWPVAGAGRR